MTTIIYTIILAVAVGFLLGLLLGLFKKIFAVEVDPKISAIREVLSGGNCGGCGYAGCDAFAAAVVAGEAPVTGCVAGGPSVAAAIAKVLGADAGSAEKKAVVLMCQGSKECAKDKGIYEGVQTCAAVQSAVGGIKACAFGCIGLGDCVAQCQFGALKMSADGLPVVDYKKCVGCGKCVKACPKHLFKLQNVEVKGAVALCACHNENKPQIKKDCAAGCFKCGICAKKCPQQAIDVSSGIPQIDYSKCDSCGTCISACPDKVLKLLQDIVK